MTTLSHGDIFHLGEGAEAYIALILFDDGGWKYSFMMAETKSISMNPVLLLSIKNYMVLYDNICLD